MKHRKIQIMTEAAFFIALYGMFFLLSSWTGHFLEESFYFLYPLPIFFFGVKHSASYTTLLLFGAFLLHFLFSSPITAFIYLCPQLVIGYILAIVYKTKIHTIARQVLTIVLFLISEVFSVLMLNAFFEIDFFEEWQNMIAGLLSFLPLRFQTTLITSLLTSLLPTFFLILAVFETMIFAIFSSQLLHRFHLAKAEKTNFPFFFYRVPRFFLAIFAVFFVCFILAMSLPSVNHMVTLLLGITGNILVLFCIFFMAQSFLLVAVYAQSKQKKGLYFAYILTLLFPPIPIVLGIYQNVSHRAFSILLSFTKKKQ